MSEKQKLNEELNALHSEYLRLNKVSAYPGGVGDQAARDMIRIEQQSEQIEDRLMDIELEKIEIA